MDEQRNSTWTWKSYKNLVCWDKRLLYLSADCFMMCTQLHWLKTNLALKGKTVRVVQCRTTKLNVFELPCSLWCSHCSDSDISFLFWSFHPLLHLSRVVKCLMLPFPHPPISMPSSLRPFLFLLINLPLIYDRTWEYCFQVLICISPTPSSSLASWFPFLPLSLYLCTGLCSAAFSSMSEQKRSLIPISLLFEGYTMVGA